MQTISIIVVGKNDGLHLAKCLESIDKLIKIYIKYNFEIIYVDSKSVDQSIYLAKSYNYVKVFKIEGDTNSAIARNIGAEVSNGNILFFVDADMEIQPDFLKFSINDVGNLVSDFVTGHIDDCFYTNDNKFINIEPRTYKSEIPYSCEYLNYSGGMFMINREMWNLHGGMNTKFRRSQDINFTLRINRNNYKLVRLPVLAVLHHTIDYNNERRMWRDLFSGDNFYPGLILRYHIANLSLILKVIRSNYSALILMFYLISFVVKSYVVIFLYLYYFIIILRVFISISTAKSSRNVFLYFLERIPYQLLSDLSFWIGFLLFFPKDKKLKYSRI